MSRTLIGHRGEPEHWPENSLDGFRAVLTAGARYVETDIQITADGVPVLSHDASLRKITGRNRLIAETSFETVRQLPAGYPERFGDRFKDGRIAALTELAGLLSEWPEARAFLDIKESSIAAFGIERVVEATLDAFEGARAQCIPISFDYSTLQHLRLQTDLPVGWVLPEWNERNRELAARLNPDYLFVNRKRLPPRAEPLWPGPWQWVVYTVNQPFEVKRFLARGLHMIETDDFRRLLRETEPHD